MFTQDTLNRFGKKVNFVYLDNGELDWESCWTWKDYLDKDGYGQFFINKKGYKAHRMAYMMESGEIPYDLSVCHKCDNPSCVNPNHLWLGTQLDNMIDKCNKDRSPKGSRHYLTNNNSNDENKIRDILISIYCGKYSNINQVCNDYDITCASIRKVLNGCSWKHVSDKVIKELDTTLKNIHDKITITVKRSKPRLLKVEEVIEIKNILKQNKMTQLSIAKKFGVSRNAISSINTGVSWAHV
jgi:predicted XRE-type DNA-binding protein